MDQGKLDEAIAILQNHVASGPPRSTLVTLLSQLYWRKNDIPKYQKR